MDNGRGILFMVLAMAAFAVEDAIIKAVSVELPPGQIVATIGVGGALTFGLVALRRREALVSRDLLAPPVMIRNLAEMTSTAAYVMALSLIPLSTASAILQGVPLVVTMGAALVLGERVGARRWAAVTVGLCGVLVIVRPGMAAFEAASLLAVLGMVTLAVRDLATRRVPESVSTAQLSAWGMASLVPAGGFLLLMPGQDVLVPSARAAAGTLAALAVGLVAYAAIIAAMRAAEASAVAPFRYVRLVFALAVAGIAFGERPDAATLWGSAIVIASGLYAFVRERRSGAVPPHPQPEPVP